MSQHTHTMTENNANMIEKIQKGDQLIFTDVNSIAKIFSEKFGLDLEECKNACFPLFIDTAKRSDPTDDDILAIMCEYCGHTELNEEEQDIFPVQINRDGTIDIKLKIHEFTAYLTQYYHIPVSIKLRKQCRSVFEKKYDDLVKHVMRAEIQKYVFEYIKFDCREDSIKISNTAYYVSEKTGYPISKMLREMCKSIVTELKEEIEIDEESRLDIKRKRAPEPSVDSITNQLKKTDINDEKPETTLESPEPKKDEPKEDIQIKEKKAQKESRKGDNSTCEYIFIKGEKKGQKCAKSCSNGFCTQHKKK